MARIKRICVYCGASGQVGEVYRAAATQLGRVLAEAGIELVYGGGRVGLMGLVADAALAQGGRVTGIIPAHLHDRELGHHGISELIVVDTMHERKRRMFELADAIAILPGGLGTLDETIEVITWRQLGLHDKPILLIDIEGYWAPLLALVDHVIAKGFAPVHARSFFRTVTCIADVIPLLAALPVGAVEAQSGLV